MIYLLREAYCHTYAATRCWMLVRCCNLSCHSLKGIRLCEVYTLSQ